jgi:hypothetical protein
MGHFFFRALGLLAAFLDIDKRNAHLFRSYKTPSTSVSGVEKRVIDHAVGTSVNAVNQLTFNTPLLIRNNRCL